MNPVSSSPSRVEPFRRFVRAFARDRAGLAGVAILVAVTVLALTAPLFIHASDLSVVDATGPSLAPPSAHYPLGTDQPGRSVLTLRSQVLAVEARPFIERAHALGASSRQVLVRHVLPNVTPLILVSTSLTVASAILSETTLVFLGLGDPTEVSWGAMLNQAYQSGAITKGAWWYLLPPGIAILIVVLGFTMTGRAIERILNPRMAR